MMFHHKATRRLTVVTCYIMCYSILLLSVSASSTGSSNSYNKIRTVIDRTGKSVSLSTEDGGSDDDASSQSQSQSNIVSVITSPGVPSLLLSSEIESNQDDELPPLFLWDDSILVGQGATLSTPSDAAAVTATGLSVCGKVSDVILIEGITMGDLETTNGILNTRHARTLTHLFHSKQQQSLQNDPLDHSDGETTIKKQTLILAITTTSDSDVLDETKLMNDVRTLYQVETVGSKNNDNSKFDDVYDVQIVTVSSSLTGSKVSDGVSCALLLLLFYFLTLDAYIYIYFILTLYL